MVARPWLYMHHFGIPGNPSGERSVGIILFCVGELARTQWGDFMLVTNLGVFWDGDRLLGLVHSVMAC